MSDGLGLTASGVCILDRKPHAKFLARVAGLVEEYGVECIILGLPRRLDGTKGPESQRTMAMAGELRRHLGIEVDTWDEWFSTKEAERVLLEADLSRQRRKQVLDKVAAVYILQNYLDRQAFIKKENSP